MKNAIPGWALALALAASLSACGQPDHGGGNQAAGHGNSQSVSDSDIGEGNDPYLASEIKMHDVMVSAVGADVSDTWVRKMIEHHKGAIAMAKIEVAHGYDTRVIPIARRVIAKQQQEVEELQGLIRQDAAPDPASAQPYRAAEKEMHEAMMAAKGSDTSHTFVRKMIPHHQGAIAMSQIVLAQGNDERVAAIARRIIADQQAELAELQGILTGAGVSAPAPAEAKPAPAEPTGNSQD
ncbi:MAG TPA: DUF305 domain-containing protein [Allosphingosinicella sp.]|nr:DUF305 domain-containing protein [Allosphingosinicella sp.]